MSEIIEMTQEEFIEKGKRLFGEDMLKWRFRCPACGHVQCAEDFRKYKDRGAKPDDAHFNCIGRFSGGDWLGESKSKSPCNYTTGGLFNISPLQVKLPDGKVVSSFNFAEDNKKKLFLINTSHRDGNCATKGEMYNLKDGWHVLVCGESPNSDRRKVVKRWKHEPRSTALLDAIYKPDDCPVSRAKWVICHIR